MITLAFRRVAIPFRQQFKHGSAERSETLAVWVEASRGRVKGVGEGCPREYVTGESLDSARRFYERHRHTWESQLQKLDDLAAWVRTNQMVIDRDPAAWCAVELAYLDLFAREQGESVEQTLSLPAISGVFRYTTVVGDSDEDTFDHVVGRYREMGFRQYRDPPLMFGAGGLLDSDAANLSSQTGLGVEVVGEKDFFSPLG